jgi:hypothetical protein
MRAAEGSRLGGSLLEAFSYAALSAISRVIAMIRS